MHAHVIRACAAAVAGALISFGLAGAAGAAGAAQRGPGAPGAAGASGQAGAVSVPTAGLNQAAGVPAGFQPVSASFLSASSGFVLGGVGCAYGHPACQARLTATTNGGAQWHFLSAPDVPLFYGAGNLLTQASRVGGVVFANRLDGWLYGPGLYATHDGGARWQRISVGGNIVPSQGGGVTWMAASAGTAWAVVNPDPFHGSADELYRSPVGTNAWARVGAMTAANALLAVSGRAAWFASSAGAGSGSSEYLWATADGVHWNKYPFRCPGAYYQQSGIAAASPSHVLFLCAFPQGMYKTEKELLGSVNGGRTEHLIGPAPLTGNVAGFAVLPHSTTMITIAVITPGQDYLYRSSNGGKTWTQVTVPDTGGGTDLGSLSYASPTVGWMVLGGPFEGPVSLLMRTADAGATWHQVRF